VSLNFKAPGHSGVRCPGTALNPLPPIPAHQGRGRFRGPGVDANPLPFNNFLPLRGRIEVGVRSLGAASAAIWQYPLGGISDKSLVPNNFLPLRGRIEVGVLRRSHFSSDG